jgi:hypothetical protein
MFEEHDMIKRAATECMCNLVMCEDVSTGTSRVQMIGSPGESYAITQCPLSSYVSVISVLFWDKNQLKTTLEKGKFDPIDASTA